MLQPTQVFSMQELPVQDVLRKRTDVCCNIWAIASFVLLLGLAFYASSPQNLPKSIFPSDSDGKICGIDYHKNKFLYYPNPRDPSQKICVRECPSSSSSRTKCVSNSRVNCRMIRPYASTPAWSLVGKYCLPRSQFLRAQLDRSLGVSEFKYVVEGALFKVETAWLAGIIISILFLIMVQLFPGFMNYAVVVLAGISLILFGVKELLTSDARFPVLKVVVAIIAIILGALLFYALKVYWVHLKIHSIFLSYATLVVSRKCKVVAYVFVFFLLSMLLLALTLFELATFAHTQLFSGRFDRTFFSVLVLIQFWWGFSTLKELFSFLVSGHTVRWYLGDRVKLTNPNNGWCDNLSRACRHSGSIIAGGLINGFLFPFDFILDLIRPTNLTTCWGRTYYLAFGWLDSFFSLVRTDAMAYINLTGLSYCNAARYCDFLCSSSPLFEGSQSASRIFRWSAFIATAGILTAFGVFAFSRTGLDVLVLVFLMTVFFGTFFVSLHADIAEAMIITFMTQMYLSSNNYRLMGGFVPAPIFDQLRARQIIVF